MIITTDSKYQSVNLYFQDESRFGLFTRNGKVLTTKGIKPICPFHQVFQSLWLFGTFFPLNGDSFLLEMPACNSDYYQLYLSELSIHKPEEFKILVLDNGAFHKAKALIVPEKYRTTVYSPIQPRTESGRKHMGNV